MLCALGDLLAQTFQAKELPRSWQALRQGAPPLLDVAAAGMNVQPPSTLPLQGPPLPMPPPPPQLLAAILAPLAEAAEPGGGTPALARSISGGGGGGGGGVGGGGSGGGPSYTGHFSSFSGSVLSRAASSAASPTPLSLEPLPCQHGAEEGVEGAEIATGGAAGDGGDGSAGGAADAADAAADATPGGYSLARTGRNLVFGLFVGGPLLSIWFRTLHIVSRSSRVTCEQRQTSPLSPLTSLLLLTSHLAPLASYFLSTVTTTLTRYEPLLPALAWLGTRSPASIQPWP